MDWIRHIFFPKSLQKGKPVGKIQIFSRHCITSLISAHKKRFNNYSRELCYRNLLNTIDPEKTEITFFLDTARGPLESHFLNEERRYPVVEIKEGTEAGSFSRVLDWVEQLDLDPNTILYFVEDDYLHQPGWIDILLEGFQIPEADYVTLYDHADKYTAAIYRKLRAQLFVTASTHWRTTPSTTNTFAVRFSTLKSHLSIHRRFSKDRAITEDHNKFCFLQRRGVTLVSPIPGWSTHAEPAYASPLIDWEKFLKT